MNRPTKPEPHDCAVMVRYTAGQYKALLKACGDEAPAVYVRRRSLAEDADPDPRVVEVHARSKCGRFDMRVGVYTMSRALGMKTRHEAQGWTVTLTEVPEQPKVGGELSDPQAQIATLTIEEITAARLRDERRRAPKT